MEPRPSYMLQAWSSAYLEGKVSDSITCEGIFSAKTASYRQTVRTHRPFISNQTILSMALPSKLMKSSTRPTIIHIVRDPRDFITSMINRGNDRGLKLIFNKFIPYFAHAEPGFKRATMSPIEREACHWAGMNRHLIKLRQDTPQLPLLSI